jgi:hypothetical protein
LDAASTSFVLGYHGCDEALAETVFAGRDVLRSSHNPYDWLGEGIYFWEHNARRAYDFACELRDRPRNPRQNALRPAVIGAVIDLGNCLNLLDSRSIELVRLAYLDLVAFHRTAGTPLPVNSGAIDLLVRDLDCEVIHMVHRNQQDAGAPAFDTVRAAFAEGGALYENSGFSAKSHIQICVRNAASIKGYFRPLGDDGRPLKFD